MSNKAELLKIQRAWELKREESDSLLAAQKNNLLGDSDGNLPSGGLPASTEFPKIPGLISGGFAEKVVHGYLRSAEFERARTQETIKAGKAAYEALKPAVNLAKSVTSDILTGDYQRSVVAHTVGAPVDLANSLLILLGIDMTNKPFMGSKQIKESLDYLSDSPYSAKFMVE